MFRFALQNLLSRPVRSLLALLGLTVAIMGMVGLFSIAVGIDDTLSRSFGRVPGLAAMQPGAPIPLFSRIPAAWAEEIASLDGVRLVRPEIWARAQLVDGRPTFSPPRLLFGIEIEPTLKADMAIYRDDVVAGRFLRPQDRGTFNCLVSRSIARALSKTVGDPIRVDNHDLTIVGIYHCDSVLLDVAILLDLAAVRKISRMDDTYVTSVYFEPDGTIPVDKLTETILARFRGRTPGTPDVWNQLARGNPGDLFSAAASFLKPSESSGPSTAKSDTAPEEALEIRTGSDWGAKVQELTGEMDIFLYLMTGIGVIIALLSILNTMLMSVAERMIEFGVLKANGWSSWDILRLITWESALLGLVGGASGCLLGWILVQVGNGLMPEKLHLYASPALLLFSLGFSTLLGILGGFYPAWWAVRMSPMDAIRRG